MRVTSNAWKTKYQPSYTFMPRQIERPISKLHNDQDYASKYDVNCILKDYHWKKSFRILGFQWMNECVFVLFYLNYICFCISSAVCLKYSSFEFLAAYDIVLYWAWTLQLLWDLTFLSLLLIKKKFLLGIEPRLPAHGRQQS